MTGEKFRAGLGWTAFILVVTGYVGWVGYLMLNGMVCFCGP